MGLRVGIIGLGAMGHIHLHHLLQFDGVTVVGVTDPGLTAETISALPEGVQVYPSSTDLMEEGDLDCVVIASPAHLHRDAVLVALDKKIPVYCEKPLVTTKEHSQEVMSAEQRAGSPLVWVGFMRRYDPLYQALKQDLDQGVVGQARFALMSHRNPSVPRSFTNADYMLETFIHEFDILRWLLGTETTDVSVLGETAGPKGFTDPQFLMLQTERGIPIVVDGHINNGYGYDIRCEVVGEKGSRSLQHFSSASGISDGPAENWKTRFIDAYRACLQAWIDDIRRDTHTGVSSAEAHRALLVALAGIKAYRTGTRVTVERDLGENTRYA